MLWLLGTSSTATLFWTSCGRLGGQGLGVELAEELAEEELLCELGRERARNLTTDLFAYLRPSFQVSSNCNFSGGTDQHISTLPGGAHQHGVFPRRSKVDVLLQHQRRTSGCVPAGLQNDNEDFIFGGQIVRQISQTFHLPCNLIALTFEATSVSPNPF